MSARLNVVAEALSWERTPFHDSMAIKSVGADCAWYPYRVYNACDVMPTVEIPNYSPQFLLHSKRQLYLEFIEPYVREITAVEELPGDFRMYWFGKCFSHGAISLGGNDLIHARKPVGVTRDEADSTLLSTLDRASAKALNKSEGDPRPVKFFTPRVWDASRV